MTRQRYCNEPVPENGGDDCEGGDTQTAACGEEPCPSKSRFGFLMTIYANSGHMLVCDRYSPLQR